MKLGFKSFHPVTQLIFYIFTFVFSLTASHPVCLAISVVTSSVYAVHLCGKRIFSVMIKLILPLCIISALINAFFSNYGVTVLFTLPWKEPFTLEAIIYGLVFSFRAAGMLLWLISFNEILTNDRILFLFGRITPKTALVLSMALRFIPLILSEAEEIKKAEKGIGGNTVSDSFTRRIKASARRLSVLVSWSLERGIDTTHSMTARGYGLKGRTSYSSYIFSFKDIIFTVFSAVTVIFFIMSSKGLTSYYEPQITIPFPAVFELLSCIQFILFMLMPFLIDISEEKKWSVSR